jgi:hypothetical protein
MAEIMKILVLEDENDSYFITENGDVCPSFKHFAKFLCQPHDWDCEVRIFCLDEDIPLGYGLADYTSEQIFDMFYFLEDCAPCPEYINFDFAFGLFWHAALGQGNCW